MNEFASAFDDDVLSLLNQIEDDHEMHVVMIVDRYARDVVERLRQTYGSIRMTTAHYGDDLRMFLEGADIVMIECRLKEGFHDLKLVNTIRLARPLVPIIALSANTDKEFVLAAYEHGVHDYLSADVSCDLLLAKLRTVKRLAEAAKSLESKNEEVVSTLRSLRTSKEKLKNEINSRINAETQKEFAEELAALHQHNKEILDNLHEGFFTVGRNLRIDRQTSASCRQIFGHEIADQPLGNALGLEPGRETQIKLNMEQVFDDFMPRSVSMQMLPSRVRTRDQRVIDLKYTVVEDKAGQAGKIIVVAADVTEQVRQQELHDRQMHHVQCLFTIIRNLESFREFLSDFKRDIREIQTSKQREVALRSLHTIKGNVSMYMLDFLAKRVHAIETLISEQQPPDRAFFAYMQKVAADLETQLRTFLAQNREVLGLEYDADVRLSYHVNSRQIGRLMGLARSEKPEDRRALLQELETLHYQDLRILTKPLYYVVQRNSMKLGKKIKLTIVGDDYRGDLKMLAGLFANLVHLINNACDHGIEDAETRHKSGKPRIGQLLLSVNMSLHGMVLSLKDDGQGLDALKILGVAQQKQLLPPEELQGLNERDTLKLIFLDGFSTADKVSQTSGRGVGMSAVKAEVERLGGRIVIDSVKGQGTVFTLNLPQILLLKDIPEPGSADDLQVQKSWSVS